MNRSNDSPGWLDRLKVHPKTSVTEWRPGVPMATLHQRHVCHLAQAGSAVYRTDLKGDVTVTTDGTTNDVKTGQASSHPVSGSVKTVTTQQTVITQSSAGAVCDYPYNRYNCKDFSGHDAVPAVLIQPIFKFCYAGFQLCYSCFLLFNERDNCIRIDLT